MLDVAISLGLVYLMLAGMVSGVQELVSSGLQLRGKEMQRGIASLLDEAMNVQPKPGSLVDRVMKHPIIDALCDERRRPAYIPAAHFSVALADELVRQFGIARPLFHGLPEAVKRLPEGDLKRTLQTLVAQSNGQPAQLQALIEGHFNLVMDRVSGWYKRRAQWFAFGIALLFTVAMNIDSLALVRHLTAHPEQSAKVAGIAGDFVRSEEGRQLGSRAAAASDPTEGLAHAQGTLASARVGLAGLPTDLPLGWTTDAAGKLKLPQGGLPALVLVGWLITALAAMLGAPFWFDLLSRFVPVRSSGKPPDKVVAPVDAPRAAPPPGPLPDTADPDAGPSPARPASLAADDPAAPRNDFEASQLNELDMLALQRALGLPADALTGRLDGSTRAALAQWQERAGRPSTGAFDEAAVMALLYP
jgi:peptidoglycan hydrolase-like protein with peptidoglycan-binding domain